jgi:hypothetical protein
LLNVAAQATDEPVIAENPPQPKIDAIARPPGIRPSSTRNAS